MDLNTIVAAITALAESNNRLAEANFALAQSQNGEAGDDTGTSEAGTAKRKRRTKAEIAAEEAAKVAGAAPAAPAAPVAPVAPVTSVAAPADTVTDAVIVTPVAAAQPPAPAFAAAVAAPVAAAPVAAAPVAAGDPGAAVTFSELLTVFQQGAGGKQFQDQVKGALVERVAAYGLTMPISDIENPMLPGAGYASLAYAARFDITQHVKAAIAHYSGAAAAAPAAGI